MKVVLNSCFGGFGLSEKAHARYTQITGNKYNEYGADANRADPALVQVVEELGSEASGMCARLRIVIIPDGVRWEIQEYDGSETLTNPLEDYEVKYAHLQPDRKETRMA